MSLRESEPLESGLRRLAVQCIECAVASLDSTEGRDFAVHTIRKRCKQIRALLRLFAGALGSQKQREMQFFHDLSRSLAHARDGKVALDVHSGLAVSCDPALDNMVVAEVRQALIAYFHSHIAEQGASRAAEPSSKSMQQFLIAAKSRARRWHLERSETKVLERGFGAAYRRARAAMRQAGETLAADDLHEARKRAKDYWYQLEFIARRWPELALERTAPARRLTELLGEAHDLVVYGNAIHEAAHIRIPRAVEVLSAVAEYRRRNLETKAVQVGSQVFRQKPRDFIAWLERPSASGQLAR